MKHFELGISNKTPDGHFSENCSSMCQVISLCFVFVSCSMVYQRLQSGLVLKTIQCVTTSMVHYSKKGKTLRFGKKN